jgi:release factor glutamine methyltransferase
MKAESVSAAVVRAAAYLSETSDTPRLDAELLMAHALDVERESMLLKHMADDAPAGFAALLDRRAQHEPIAYILGWRDFWTIRLKVGPGALIPRPDSETLLEAAQAHFASHSPKTILDLGTGPGTLLFSALSIWDKARGMGVDASEAALLYARHNMDMLGMAERVQLRVGNWAEGLNQKFDLILCNPPYVETRASISDDVRGFEPASALFAGVDGLDAYRILIPQLPARLHQRGIICLEIGHTQALQVRELFAKTGMQTWVAQDLAGRDRCICAKF